MCTIIIKLFKNLRALPACFPTNYHCLKAIDIETCINTVSGLTSMHKLSLSYSSVMPAWIRDTQFNPELERHRLSSHEYCEKDSVESMRQMKDVHLIDFVELTLKSKDDFDAAFDVVLNTKLAEYLKLFLLPQPGDWPAQFYSRQIVYETLQKFCQHTPPGLSSSPQGCQNNHTYSDLSSFQPERERLQDNLTQYQPAILSTIPTIGPLHISLNGQETLFKEFRPFFADLYTKLFPKSKLAKNPKPWRINLILELVYGGWLFIRSTVKDKFAKCKDLEYRTLINLLDNYLPLVLTIYTVTFKLNDFHEYFYAMIRIWTMFVCFERRHYNKAPLVWLAMVAYWAIHHPLLYKMLQTSLIIFDEYPVENAHSIIRG